MPLFEVAVLEKPTKKDAEESGAIEKLIHGPEAVVATDEKAAAIIVAIKNPDLKIDVSRMEVLVRPFG